MRVFNIELLPVLLTALIAAQPFSDGVAEQVPLQKRQQLVDNALKKVTPSLVSVHDGFGAGSGVVVSADGIVLTASHVVDSRRRHRLPLSVMFPDGAKYRAKLLGMNRFADAAMLKITEPYRKGTRFPHVELGRSSELKRGDWCFALGHPGGFRAERPAPVRLGRVLSVGHRTVVSDCAIVLGDSGGPLFDLSGQLIGIHSMITEVIVENRHVAVDVFRRDGERMEAGETWGELQAQDLDLVETDLVGLLLRWRSNTAEVSHVVQGSPADEAGIYPGDILLKVNEQLFADPLGLSTLLTLVPENDTVSVVVDRHGEEKKLSMITGHQPSEAALHERRSNKEFDGAEATELLNQLTSMRRVGPFEKRTPEELEQFAPVVADQKDCVVEFRELGETLTLGTVVSADGYIITKASELDNAIDPEVILSSGRRLPMIEVATDRAFDLMLVKVDADNLRPVKWSSAGPPQPGRILITTDSRGTPLLPGVVSVAARKLATSGRGFLGVVLARRRPDSRPGVGITDILPGGAAERAGLKAEDRVLSINDRNVHTQQEMIRRIAAFPPNSEISMRVERAGVVKTFDVVLTPKFLEEDGDVMLSRYRNSLADRRNHGKYASAHNAGFPEALQHDTDLYPNQCGGPVFDITGKAVGLNIARAARITSYAIPAAAVQRIYRQLKADAPAAPKKRAS